MNREYWNLVRRMLRKAIASLSDEDALDATILFSAWKPDTAYELKQRIRYNGKLYRCEQAHTSQANWTPDATPALWTEVAEPGTIPVWKQPTGAQDAYRIGKKVKYPDEHGDIWISVIDYNTYQPGVYGWEKE